VHRDADLAVADLAERARVLALDSGRVLAVLGKAGVVENPGLHLDRGHHPLGDGAQHRGRLPGAVGEELLHRLVVGLTV
jgi:hypothetical protein